MIWVYLVFVGSLVLPLLDGDNPFANPVFWIFGAIIALHVVSVIRSNRESPAASSALSIAPDAAVASAGQGVDMLRGLRGWTAEQCPADVAVATCSLSGRSNHYLRSLLVAATQRNDEAGRIVAAATRRLLTSDR